MGEGTGARAGYRNCLYGHDMISCPVNDLLYEPSPRPLGTPLPSMGEGTGARAGYRNCLYGHDMNPDVET